MNNPIAQLIAQAETGLSDLSRRAIDSVTMPIKAKSQEVVSEVTASLRASLVTIAIRAGLGLFAGVMFIVALCYGLSALHAELAIRLGAIEATLIIGGVFLALAIIALLVLALWPSRTPAKAVVARPARALLDAEALVAKANRDAARAAATAAAQPIDAQAAAPESANPLADMKSGLGAIASALGEAGFRREQAGLRAGLAIAEQLKPMQIVGLALIGGFVAGARGRRRG